MTAPRYGKDARVGRRAPRRAPQGVALRATPPHRPRLGELGGEETRRLAVDVFSKLSPPGSFHGSATGGTLAEEGAQTTAMLLEFLKHVRYVPEDIDDAAARKGWALGDHDVVLPALKWVLDNRVRCEKRAYVGHFMADYVVPGEYAMDPEIQDLMNNTHESQRAFVEAHRECEAARKEAKDPIKLKSQISDLEREREQVERRIAVTKGKVAQRVTDPRELEELVALASSLREEQAQEHELARQTRDQVERRDLADQRRNRAASRTRELRRVLSVRVTHGVATAARRRGGAAQDAGGGETARGLGREDAAAGEREGDFTLRRSDRLGHSGAKPPRLTNSPRRYGSWRMATGGHRGA